MGQSELQNDAGWSSYFMSVYGEIPWCGYPICVGAFHMVPVKGKQPTSAKTAQCHDTKPADGTLVDQMSPCCDPPNGGGAHGLVTYIYQSKNQKHNVPDNTWFEGQHVVKGGEKGAAWYYQVFGSAVWVYTGKMLRFKDHPQASDTLLKTPCSDQNHPKAKVHTECEFDFPKWWPAAKALGYDSMQFTEHYDCGCGENGVGSWAAHTKLCNTEIIDMKADGTKACASGFYLTGWAGSSDCDCDNSKKYASCKGRGTER